MQIIRGMAGRGWYGWLVLALAVLAAVVTWFYGFWKSPVTGLIFLPIGVVVFFASVGALAMPAVTAALVAVAAIVTVDKGLQPTVVFAAKVFLGVGFVSFVWHFWKASWRR
jgi:hypothetical protein